MRAILILIPLLLFGLLSTAGCQPRDEPTSVVDADAPQALRPTSHRDLESFFARHNYRWNNITDGVPPFILETLPTDLHSIGRISEKKRLFFLSLLPMVLLANDDIRDQRQKLQDLLETYNQVGFLTPDETDQLHDLKEDYGVKGDVLEDADLRRKLLARVDVIPPSLVLAQAATESAYGTSRFARRANNLFGEWTFIPGTGLVPADRPEGATYEVRRFPSVAASLKSYMKNINTHWAYRDFRRKRAQLRAAGKPLRGIDLAEGLERYSTRGPDYVNELRQIIRRNRLTRLSEAALRQTEDQPADDVRIEKGNGLLSSGPLSHRHRSDAAETRAD